MGTNGAHFGFGSGQFYATPAVAFGRVYMGNTDGRVYSFGARNGALAWATATGAYVYASASVADPAGLGPTVYVGSYDGNLYAFNAQSGAIRWRHPAGGKISGSSTVVGNVVYYSDLGTKTTIGLNAATGRKVFAFPDGAFTPVIADYHAIYLDGYTELYQLLPGRQRWSPSTITRGRARRRRASTRRSSARRTRPNARCGGRSGRRGLTVRFAARAARRAARPPGARSRPASASVLQNAPIRDAVRVWRDLHDGAAIGHQRAGRFGAFADSHAAGSTGARSASRSGPAPREAGPNLVVTQPDRFDPARGRRQPTLAATSARGISLPGGLLSYRVYALS